MRRRDLCAFVRARSRAKTSAALNSGGHASDVCAQAAEQPIGPDRPRIATQRGDTASAEAVIANLHRIQRPYLFGANLALGARIAGQVGQCERAAGLLQEGMRKGLPQQREVPEFARLECAAFKQYMAPRK